MKTIIRMAMIAIFAMTFQSCSLNNDPIEDGNHRLHQPKSNKVYKFKLSLGGDYVEQSEEPLVRASAPNTYVGINVTRLEKGHPDTDTQKYAYGMFKSKDDISIDLESGYTYNFEATILRDGTDKYVMRNGSYNLPFTLGEQNQSKGYDPSEIGSFKFDQNKNLTRISYGDAFVDLLDNTSGAISEMSFCTYPRVDRYYGIIQNIDPEYLVENNKPIEIPLYYRCFGLKIIADDLPEDTYLTVKDDKYDNHQNNYEFLIFPQNLEFGKNGILQWESIYSMNDLKSDSKITFNFTFTWHRGVGKEETFPCTISVGPNIKKTLVISVTGNANKHMTGNVILNEITSSFTEENQDVIYNGSSD